jgi:membrane associated rhomboid family serine protease
MLNDPPPEKRRVHPLEKPPQQVPPNPDETPPQPQRHPVTLHIPSVRPTVTYALLAINIGIFVIRVLSPALDQELFLWGANNQMDVLLNGEFYRLFTSMFLHASIYDGVGGFALQNSLHLIFNAYILYQVGSSVERLFGHVRFAIIYLLGGLAGSVASAVLGDPRSYSVGASGAVFAILGAELIYLYQHRKLLGAGGRIQMRSVVTFMLINFAFGFLTTLGRGAIRVDNWAHLGGAVGGAALAWFIAPLYIVRRHPERPNALLGEDINPLKNRYWAVSLFGAVLLLVLIAGRTILSG